MEQVRYHGSTLEYLTVYPDGYDPAQAYPLICCLHGYGANMEDLTGLAPVLDPAGYLHVFPNAPLAAIDGADATMRAWYERGGNESREAVATALAALDRFVQEVLDRYRVATGQALLLGFSQGGAMALRYGLAQPDLFAGIAVLSGSLRRLEDLQPHLPGLRSQPVFVAHGTEDSLVPAEYSRRLVAFLEGGGYRPFFRTYPIDHQISPAEVKDLRNWLHKILPGRDGRQQTENDWGERHG
jgi:phospholipase/carboxylesterase